MAVADQRLDELRIEGFTSIRSAHVQLGAMNVLVGANGAGKSNFIQALGMLGRIAAGELERYTVFHGGASTIFNKSDSRARINLSVRTGLHNYDARLVAAPNDGLAFDMESVFATDPANPSRSVLGQGHRETKLGEPSDTQSARIASEIILLLQECNVYHFDDTSTDAPVKRMVPTADNLTLRDNAENLAAVLLRIKNSDQPRDRAAYRRITGTIRLVAPFFRDFVLDPEAATDRIRLRWLHKDFDGVFSAEQMSDGTLRFICLATLLQQPQLPALVVLDEPELGQHPYAIGILADLLRQAATRSQIVVTTQSVTLMNQFTVNDLVVVEQEKGNSVFKRRNEEQLRNWLKEYSLGELWEKNILGGQPGPTGSILDD